MNLNEKKKAVLEYMLKASGPRTGGWCSPTTIGLMALGKPHSDASTHACRVLRLLKADGFVDRMPPGLYRLTEAGRVELTKMQRAR